MTGRRTDQIKVYHNGVGLAAVHATNTSNRLDPSCVNAYGEQECSRLAHRQNINTTLFDTLTEAGFNVTIQGKTHIGAGFAHPRGTGRCDARQVQYSAI